MRAPQRHAALTGSGKPIATHVAAGEMLALGPAHLAAILGHAREAAPEEACGILGGRRSPDGALRVEVVHRCRNVAPQPRLAYLADPRDQLAAFLDIEDARGLEVVGFYHSHPRGPPGPSLVDAARAAYPGCAYLIAWLAPREGWGAWRWDGARFVAEALVVEAGEASEGAGGAVG